MTRRPEQSAATEDYGRPDADKSRSARPRSPTVTRRLLIATLTVTLALAGCQGSADRDELFQTSTIAALMAGSYDGHLTCGQLRQHGDFGLGTFDALDGEMIVLDGQVYQARVDGTVVRVDDALTTPFATITFFDIDQTHTSPAPADLDQLKAHLDAALPDPHRPYAVRLTGQFKLLKIRSVPAQPKPYPPLAEAAKHQVVWEHQHITGTLVGSYMPAWAKSINVPSYHFHFLSQDLQIGGHVLGLTIDQPVEIVFDDCSSVKIDLPAEPADVEVGEVDEAQLHRIEN